ncbi:hypothetical protein LINPERHAP2_LOCUS37773 [Linum perenne]
MLCCESAKSARQLSFNTAFTGFSSAASLSQRYTCTWHFIPCFLNIESPCFL